MAKYEKRQIKKVKLNKKSSPRRTTEQKPEYIKMTNATKKPAAQSKPRRTVENKPKTYRVIKGRKLKKSSIFVAVIAVVLLFIMICQLSLPTGILEFLQNSYSLQSTSGSGTDSLMGVSFLQMNARYGRVDLLSGAYYEVYNKNGGTAYTVQHGYTSPVMVNSASRTLIYDRNSTDCSVYNLSKCVQNLKIDGKIYTATISRNAKVALAYKSNDYLSVIEVYNKRNKLLFTENFADEYVTSMALNTTGRYLTAVTLYSKGGIYHSNLYIFDVQKGKQISKTSYENLYFTESVALSRSASLVVSYDKAIIASSKGTVTELPVFEKISNYSVSKNGTIGLVCNQTNNVIDNTIRLFNKKGEKKTELDFTGTVDGFSISDSHIYILSDGTLYSYTVKDLKKEETAFENAQLLTAFNGGAAAVSGAKLLIE